MRLLLKVLLRGLFGSSGDLLDLVEQGVGLGACRRPWLGLVIGRFLELHLLPILLRPIATLHHNRPILSHIIIILTVTVLPIIVLLRPAFSPILPTTNTFLLNKVIHLLGTGRLWFSSKWLGLQLLSIRLLLVQLWVFLLED